MAFSNGQLLILLSVLAVWVTAQIDVPASFGFDCKRTGVGCENDAICNLTSSICDCTDVTGYEGYNCGLQTDLKLDACTSATQCYNDGICLQSNACFCNSDTYGNRCENPRAEMWCTDSEMFINVNPHGTFAGKIYLRKLNATDENNKGDTNCLLLSVANTAPDLDNTYTYVETVQGVQPTLAGYYIAQQHSQPDGATDFCQTATVNSTEGRTEYIQQVIIEYSTVMVSSVDQIITFNCTISDEAGTITSINAMDVSLDSDDLSPVDVVDEIVAVEFEIIDPENNVVITNDVSLGDPLDLTFTLQTSGDTPTDDTITQFKVVSCTAMNTADETDADRKTINFVAGDCPTEGSEMLYRGQIAQQESNTKTVIPIYSFRFIGPYDSVIFTCTLKLCTQADLATNPEACTKTVCPGDSVDGGGEAGGETTEAPGGGGVTGAAGGGVTGAQGGGVTGAQGGGVTGAQGGGVTGAPAGRRKRSADSQEEKEVSKSIKVVSPLGSAQSNTGAKETPKEEEAAKENQADCMQHSEVVIIIVIFTVLLFLLVLALVCAVVSLLRSRQKVVDATDNATTETHSRYTLPRLSLTTTM